MSPDEDLRLLAPAPPGAGLESRALRVAQRELAAARRPPWRGAAAVAFRRVALPAAIALTMVGYLHWAVRTARALYP